MTSLTRSLGIAFFAAILAGAPSLAQDVNVDYDHSYQFNQIKSYSWGKIQASDPLIEPRLSADINNVIQGYGFNESAKDKKGDLIITAIDANNPEQYVAFYRGLSNLDWHRGWGSGGFSDSAAQPRQIHGGTLIVDIYDGATGKLVWRGIAAGGGSATGGDDGQVKVGFSPATPQEKANLDNVDRELKIMFADYPPKSGGPIPPNQHEVPPSPSSTPLTSPN
ncbi:MAG: DUF4136 domain-containing protein [Acidobacteriaceae bacterium]|jgi:hypothetical protein